MRNIICVLCFSISTLHAAILKETNSTNTINITQTHSSFGNKTNLIKLIGAADFHERGFYNLGAFGIHYGQPNTFFRLPARMVLELEGFVGSGQERALNQMIFGVAEDVLIPIFDTNFYAGAGIGIYIRTLLDTRMDSAFTFGEKVFIGYQYSPTNAGGGGRILL